MSDITIKNDLDSDLLIYDSFEQQDADNNYYGTLTRLADAKGGTATSVEPLHSSVNTLILFDQQQKPLARFVSMFGENSFEVSQKNVTAMSQAMDFVAFIGQNPGSDLAVQIKKLKAAKDIDGFFQQQSAYNLVTADTYMMALTYKAAHPDTVDNPPETRTYSLSTLVKYLSGKPYPVGMPDITISDFFYRTENDIYEFGGKVTLQNMPYENDTIGKIIYGLLPADKELNVKVSFDLQVGLNMGGSKIEFFYRELDIPLGNGNGLRIKSPTIALTINPLFKFVIFEVSADFPFQLFEHTYDTILSMVIDNVEVEAGFAIKGDHNALPAPGIFQGIHFDEFGFGMGIMFEPPGFALGVMGKFHIGKGTAVVGLDDDTFAIILDLEEEVPNPVYLSFYVPKFDFDTLVAVFTDINISIDFPVTFSDLSFVWNENPMEPLALPDGSMSKGGYAFSGYMDLFGLTFFTDIEIDMQKFTGIATMAPLNLGGILKLSGDGKEVTRKVDANGTIIKNNVVPKTDAERKAVKNATTKTLIAAGGPEMNISTLGSPYFTLDAQASILGLINQKIDARIDNGGIRFELDYGTVITSKMQCQLKTSGSFTGSFCYGPDLRIPLPEPLGHIHLVDTINAAIGLTVSKSAIDFSVSGGFDFEGISMNLGTLNLDVNISGISDVITACGNHIIDDAASIFAALLKDIGKWAELAFKGIVSGVENIASGLQSYFKQSINDASKILYGIGMAADQAAKDLKTAYNATAGELATAMKFGFNIEGEVMATMLKGLDYSADQIGGVLHSVFGINGAAAAQVMKDIGIPAQQITMVLSDVFKLSPNTISDVLKGVGFPVSLIADTFKAIGGPFTSVGNALDDALNTVVHYANPSHW